MQNLLVLAVGGTIGTLLRYAVNLLVYKNISSAFPWNTLIVNLSGSFLIGVLWELFQSGALSEQARLFLIVGLLGAFTTFSSFSLENVNLIKTGAIRIAFFYILLSNVLGLILVFAGSILTRSFLK